MLKENIVENRPDSLDAVATELAKLNDLLVIRHQKMEQMKKAIVNVIVVAAFLLFIGAIYEDWCQMFYDLGDRPLEIIELSGHTQGRFDTIYPSHGSFPISSEVIPKLISGAKQILSGQEEGKVVDMFGQSVMLYQFEVGVFYTKKCNVISLMKKSMEFQYSYIEKISFAKS